MPSYIDIYTYPGEHHFFFGHTGISVNGGRAYGLEPIPGQDVASAFGPVRGYVQPVPNERTPDGHVRIQVPAPRAEAVKQYILSNPGVHSYALAGPNCVSFVQGALDEAGVKSPSDAFLMTPSELLKALSQANDIRQP